MSQKETLLQRAESKHREFSAGNSLLDWADMEPAGLIEGRPWKEVVGHIAIWQEIACTEMIKILAAVATEVDFNDSRVVDSINAVISEHCRSLTPQEVVNRLYFSHQRLISLMSSLTDKQLESHPKIREWFGVETFQHYEEHWPGLRNYLAKKRLKKT